MATNVLHGYYELGGETVRDASFTIGAALNARIPGVPLAIEQTVPDVDTNEGIGTIVRSYQIPAFHHDDPGHFKLPLFFVKGNPGRVEFVRTKLSQKIPTQTNPRYTQKMPEAHEGKNIANYLKRNYQFSDLVFNGLSFQYEGLDLANRPMGGIRMELDQEASQNQPFFAARASATRVIRAISTRVHVEVNDSVRIGGVNMQSTTPEWVERITNGISHEIRDRPVIVQIGNFILKNKILDSDSAE